MPGEGYIARLVAKGYKVAICEQTEDPKTAKGLVKREVIRVITPGTVIDPAMLPSSAAAYLMAIAPGTKGGDWGMALLDISTGEFSVSALPAGELSRISGPRLPGTGRPNALSLQRQTMSCGHASVRTMSS